MKDVIKNSMPKKDYQKVAKQIVLIGIIASVMMYAGFTSAVWVSRMDKFWVDIQLPQAFTISTIVIAISSLTLVLALLFAKKGNKQLTIAFIGVTLLLGIVFSVYQFKGWASLFESGNTALKNSIFFNYGAYGNQYVVLKNGKEITHNGSEYSYNGKVLTDQEVEELREFTHQICGDDLGIRLKPYQIENYGNPYTLKNILTDQELQFENGVGFLNGDTLSVAERDELFKFSYGVYNETPYFAIKGDYGKDFTLSLNGETLGFENKKLYFPERKITEQEIQAIKKTVFQGGQEYVIKKGKVYLNDEEIDLSNFETYIDLNKGIQIHLKNGEWTQLKQELNTIQYGEFYQTANVASSYVWILTFLHFLHLIIGLILLIVLLVRAIRGLYDRENQMGLRVGGIFWHFLGALWIYLFVFLQYIS